MENIMNNIWIDIILPATIIIIFLGVLVYQIFFRNKKLTQKNNTNEEETFLYNAHIRNSSPSANEEFKILEKNNIKPRYLAHELGE